MRLSNRFWTVLAGGLAGGLTTLVIVLPSVHFAYQSATLHATIETAAALVALLAAYLALSRFRATGRSDDLALTTALGHIVFSLLTTDKTSSARRGNPTPQMGLTALAKPRLSLDRGML
jgi:hypothetical protein